MEEIHIFSVLQITITEFLTHKEKYDNAYEISCFLSYWKHLFPMKAELFLSSIMSKQQWFLKALDIQNSYKIPSSTNPIPSQRQVGAIKLFEIKTRKTAQNFLVKWCPTTVYSSHSFTSQLPQIFIFNGILCVLQIFSIFFCNMRTLETLDF